MVAKRRRMTVAEWFRQVLRSARQEEPTSDPRRKLEVLHVIRFHPAIFRKFWRESSAVILMIMSNDLRRLVQVTVGTRLHTVEVVEQDDLHDQFSAARRFLAKRCK